MARPGLDLRQYLRRPDRDFWLALLKAPPRGTATAAVRRQRLARYALGAAAVFTLPYVLVSALVDWQSTWPLVLLNTFCAVLFGLGMWLAALGRHAAARLLLMVTLEAQVLALAWLTGPALNIVVFALVAAALARVLFTVEEHRLQVVFIGVPVLTLVAGMLLFTESRIDFSALPGWLLQGTQVANALVALACVLLVLGLFEREVLGSELDLIEARARSDSLLHAVLPHPIAERLRAGERSIAERHPGVTVLFADIAGFTPWSSQQEPETVVAMLEQVFSRFDARVAAAGAEKIKTIGDAYMVIAGAPAARDDHAQVIARLALQLLEDVRRVREETGIDLNLRVGIHSGEVIAGVIGALRFSYDVWGDTVNTASRMESHGEPGRIQLSDETRRQLGDAFTVASRGTIQVKGKGGMQTWWLLGPA